MTPPRFLVPVDFKLPDLATAQERLKDCRARKTPTFVFESTQTGIATRKDLFAEAMLENSPTRPPRRVGDFVVSAAVQFLFLTVLLLVPLYFSEAIDVHQFNKLLLAFLLTRQLHRRHSLRHGRSRRNGEPRRRQGNWRYRGSYRIRSLVPLRSQTEAISRQSSIPGINEQRIGIHTL
jgi:hypothetical protein